MPENHHPPVKVFISYSHKDNDLCQELVTHMAPLKWSKTIDLWTDAEIDAGGEWDAEIKEELKNADIILLLVSPTFLASRYIHNIELKAAMERHESKESVIIPIILRQCDWRDMEFRRLKALPRDSKPISSWDDRDDALYDVVKSIKAVAKKIQKRKAEAPDEATTNTADTTDDQGQRAPALNPNQQEINDLNEIAAIHREKLSYLRKQHAIQTGSSAKFQLKKEIEAEEAELKKITDEIKALN